MDRQLDTLKKRADVVGCPIQIFRNTNTALANGAGQHGEMFFQSLPDLFTVGHNRRLDVCRVGESTACRQNNQKWYESFDNLHGNTVWLHNQSQEVPRFKGPTRKKWCQSFSVLFSKTLIDNTNNMIFPGDRNENLSCPLY